MGSDSLKVVSFWGNENVVKLDSDLVAQYCECIASHWLYMLKMIKAVNFREIEREWGRPTLGIFQPSKFTDEKTQTQWGKVICQLIIGTARLDPGLIQWKGDWV